MTVPLAWRAGELRLRAQGSVFFDTTLDLVQAIPNWAQHWHEGSNHFGYKNQAFILPTPYGLCVAYTFPMGLN